MKERYTLGLRGKTTLGMGGLVLLALIVTALTGYWQSKSIAEQKVLELEQSKLSVYKHEIEGALIRHRNNLFSLRDVPPIQAIVRARTNNPIDPESGDSLQEWRERLASIFTAFLSNQPPYFQVRYLDAAGNELVKVERTPQGEVVVVPELALQNKSDSRYVTETLRLPEGETYYSDVTLNQEHGVYQQPYVPVLRLATPVYSQNKQIFGLIIINLSSNALFADIRSEVNGVQRSIADEQGFYLKHPIEAQTFGQEKGSEFSLGRDAPELADAARIHDTFIEHNADSKELSGFQKIYFSPLDKTRYWLLILHVPESVVFAGIDAALNRMLLVCLIIGILSLIAIVWFVSRNILTPVTDLAAAAEKLQQGDLTVRLDSGVAKDEFKTLYRALNAFAENQQHATAKLTNDVDLQTKSLSAVIDNIIDGIITISERGIIESFNPAARRIFGYSDAEVIGKNVKMLMPEPYHSEHDGYLDHFVKTGEKKVIGIGREVVGSRKDGSTFPMDLAVSEIVIDNVRHFVGITRDITERKRVEQMQKEFISTVSHELRTPLTSIRGSLGLILGGVIGELPEKARVLLTIANNNSERLIHLINDILDIEKISAGKMQFDVTVQDIVPVIRQAVEANKGYGDQLDVLFILHDCADSAALVRIDEKRIAQVMSNLLSNAAKYSPAHDTVTIDIDVAAESVRISVHDNGEGIPEAFKARVFSKFAQADSSDTRQKDGTGLGLNITQAIVEKHGGSIDFVSDKGEGTTFYFDLPLWQDKKQVDVPVIEAPDAETPLLLIIEDDRDVSALLSLMLQKQGYRFHQAFSYQDAIEKIQNHRYSAVTLDLMIPGGSGISLLHFIRKNAATRYVPVIVVSAKAREGKLEVESEAFNMVDWIDKPIDENRLIDAIHSGLSQAIAKGGCILHVEDDPDIAMIVDSVLSDVYKVTHAETLVQARRQLSRQRFDLVLLDIGLPDGSGLDLLPQLNSFETPIPVVIFSAQELGPDITSQVTGALVKSRTDNDQVMQQIKQVLENKPRRD